MRPIAINPELNISCEITQDNYQNIVVLYVSNSKDIFLAKNRFKIMLESEAIAEIKAKGNHLKYFKNNGLTNALEAYFKGTLTEDCPENECCISMSPIEQPVILVPTISMIDSASAEQLMKGVHIDPQSRKLFTHAIQLPIISFLLEQMAYKEEKRQEDQPLNAQELGQNLLIAAEANNLDGVKALFQLNVEPTNAVSTQKKQVGWNSLHFAVYNGNIEMMVLLLEKYPYGIVPLQLALKIAFEKNDAAAIPILLANGAVPDYQVFIDAINDKHWDAVSAFIRFNQVIDFQHDDCRAKYGSALVKAAYANQIEVVKELIKVNAPAEYFYKGNQYFGWGALHFAVHHGNCEMMTCLLNANIDPNMKYQNAPTPLQLAFEENKPEGIGLLLKAGAKLTYGTFNKAVNDKHWLAVLAFVKLNLKLNENYRQAYGEALLKASSINNLELVQGLLEADAPVHCVCSDDKYIGWFPLHFAIHFNNTDMMVMLLKNKANPNKKLNDGPTALQLAFEKNNGDAIELLLKSGATPDYQAFTEAVKAMHWDAVFAFVTANSELIKGCQEIINVYSDALLAAAAAKQGKLLDALLDIGFGALHFAVNQNNKKLLVQLLLKNKLDINEKNARQQTPLHLAFENDNPVAIGLLLKSGATADYQDFMKAVNEKYWDAVTAFVKSNPVSVEQNEDCKYAYAEAFIKAAEANQIELINDLIKAKAPMNHGYCDNGYGALHFVIQQGNHKMMESLLTSKIDPNMQKMSKGQAPLEFAFQKDDPEAIALLLKHSARPNYQAFTKAVADKHWLSVLAFLKFNPENTEQSKQCKHAYDEALSKAVKDNQPEAITLLFQKGARPDYQAFTNAVKEKHWSAIFAFVIENLEQAREKQEIRDAYSDALFAAAEAKQEDLQQVLLDLGFGSIHFAVDQGDNDLLAQLLLQNKFNLNEKNARQQTPLQDAFEKDNPVAIGLLLKSGATADYQDFTKAVNNKHWAAVSAFVKSNPVGVEQNEDCKNAYAYAFVKAANANQLELINNLINAKAPMNRALNHNGYGALHCAIQQGNHKMMVYLLTNEIDSNMKLGNGPTPLQIAFQKADPAAIDLLLTHGARPDYQIFIKAIKDKQEEAALAFVESNPSSDAIQVYGSIDALFLAAEARLDKLKTALIIAGCGSLHSALQDNNNVELEQLLLVKKVNSNEKDISGKSPLEIAFAKSNAKAITLLLKNGATADYQEFNKAVKAKKWELVLAFIRSNSKQQELNKHYGEALVMAAAINQTEVISALVEYNAPLHYKCSDNEHFGWYPLHFAVHHNNSEVIELLLNNKVNPDIKYMHGLTALELALEQNKPEAVALLLKHWAKVDNKAFLKAVKNRHWEAVLAYVNFNPISLGNQSCRAAYTEALNLIDEVNDKSEPVIRALIPALFLNVINLIKESLSDKSKESPKGNLLEQASNKLLKSRFCFLDDLDIKSTLKKLLMVAVQRENYSFFKTTNSSIALREYLKKPEAKYFLTMICGSENLSPEEEHLKAFILDKPVFTFDSNDEDYFSSSNKEANYSNLKFS